MIIKGSYVMSRKSGEMSPAFGLVFLVIGCVVAVVVPRAMKKVAAV